MSDPRPREDVMSEPLLPLAADTLLPHKGRMCCIDLLTAFRGTEAETETLLRPEHVLLDRDGRMDPCGFIELAAQSAGAMYGARAAGQSPGPAMLVSMQKVALLRDARVGDRLRVTVSVLGELEGMISLSFSVRRAAEQVQDRFPLAEGRLTAYLPGASGNLPAAAGAITAGGAPPPVPGGFLPPAAGSGLPESVARCLRQKPGLVEQRDNGVRIEGIFVFPPDFPGFDGHFPGNPIVPGIVQIMAAARTAALGADARVREVRRCKFLRPVAPCEEVRVRTDLSGGTDGSQCRAQLAVGSGICAEMNFSFIAGALPGQGHYHEQ